MFEFSDVGLSDVGISDVGISDVGLSDVSSYSGTNSLSLYFSEINLPQMTLYQTKCPHRFHF